MYNTYDEIVASVRTSSKFQDISSKTQLHQRNSDHISLTFLYPTFFTDSCFTKILVCFPIYIQTFRILPWLTYQTLQATFLTKVSRQIQEFVRCILESLHNICWPIRPYVYGTSFVQGGWGQLAKYIFHCVPENQVVLPEYYMIFCLKMAIWKILGGRLIRLWFRPLHGWNFF